MKKLTVRSSLTDKEIADNFKDTDFFSGIMSGLEEALAYEKDPAGFDRPSSRTCRPAAEELTVPTPRKQTP